MQFYKDDKGTINPDLIGKRAFEDSQNILNVSPTQMRRIFNQIKNIEQKIDKDGWDKIEPLVRLQKAQLVYTIKRGKKSAARDDKPAWDKLNDLMIECIDSVKNASDYKALALYMEALYAYYYAKTPKRV